MVGTLTIRSKDAQGKGQMLLLLAGVSLPLFISLLVIESYWIPLAALGALSVLATLLAINPRDVLLMAFLYLPFQSLLSDVFGGSIPAIAVCKDVLMVIIIASFTLRYFRRNLYVNSVIYCLLGFISVAVLLVPLSPDPLRAILQLRCMVIYPLIIVLAANMIETPEQFRNLLRAFAIVGAITVVYGAVQYFTLFDVPYRNAGGSVMQRMGRFDEFGAVSTFASRPDFGGYLIPLFLLFFQLNLWPSKKFSWLFRLVMMAAIPACVLLTFSRTIWLALAISGFVALYLRDKVKAVLCAMAMVVLLLIALQAKSLFMSSSMQEAATSNESFLIRLSYWPLVFQHVLSNPFGMGLGTVGGAHLFESSAETDSYGNLQYDPNTLFDASGGLGANNILSVTDNNYLKFMVQGGFPLLAAFLAFVISVLRLARKLIKVVRDPWLRDMVIWATASITGLLTIFLFVDFMESVPSTSVFWLAAGALCFVSKLYKTELTGKRPSGLRPAQAN